MTPERTHEAHRHDARAHQLADDFDDLAKIERIQDRHRRELSRRQELLDVEQQVCNELETHLAHRLDLLLREAVMLERTGQALPAAAGGPRPGLATPSKLWRLLGKA